MGLDPFPVSLHQRGSLSLQTPNCWFSCHFSLILERKGHINWGLQFVLRMFVWFAREFCFVDHIFLVRGMMAAFFLFPVVLYYVRLPTGTHGLERGVMVLFLRDMGCASVCRLWSLPHYFGHSTILVPHFIFFIFKGMWPLFKNLFLIFILWLQFNYCISSLRSLPPSPHIYPSPLPFRFVVFFLSLIVIGCMCAYMHTYIFLTRTCSIV